MNLLLTRVLAAIVLFVLTLLVGTVPVLWYQWWLKRKGRQQTTCGDNQQQQPSQPVVDQMSDNKLSTNFYVQIVTQMGGGILFFTVFVHMIPDVRNNFEIYLKSNDSIFNSNHSSSDPKSIEDLSVPYLEIAICLGFFSIYFIEVLMHSLLDNRSYLSDIPGRPGIGGDSHNRVKYYDSFETNKTSLTHEDKHHLIVSPAKECDEKSALLQHRDHVKRKSSNHSIDNDSIVIVIEHRSVEDDQRMVDKQFVSRFLHGLVIICTFSVHSIFDGISIAARNNGSEIWTVFIAIASHKLMIACIIGVELYEKCQNYWLVWFHMTIFAIMSPIGIFFIILAQQSVDSHNPEANPVVILLSAIASGTILYIVFFEILQKTRVNKLSPIIQFMSMSVGFGLMFAITSALKED